MRLPLAFLAAGIASIATTALAVPITFTFSANSTGTLAGVPFGPTEITFTVQGNTESRTQSEFDADVYFIPAISTIVSIDAVGDYAFVTPTLVFSNVSFGVGLSDSSGGDLFDIDEALGWDMLSDISYTGPAGWIGQWETADMVTTGGTLILDNAEPIAASFSATLVPEPTSMALVAVGAVAALRRVRRKA